MGYYKTISLILVGKRQRFFGSSTLRTVHISLETQRIVMQNRKTNHGNQPSPLMTLIAIQAVLGGTPVNDEAFQNEAKTMALGLGYHPQHNWKYMILIS